DGGITWKSIYPSIAFFNSVYAVGNRVFAIVGQPGITPGSFGPFVMTDDDGATWNTIFAAKTYNPTNLDHIYPYITGNKDSLVCTEAVDMNGANLNLFCSTDLGATWVSNTLDQNFRSAVTYTIGIFSFPHCTDLLRTRLSPNSDRGPIEHSANFGKTWTTLLQSAEIGAWIAGNNCMLYTSNANGSLPQGPLRSSDRGLTWQYINGPNFTEIDDRDFHNISVVGGGAVVYAGDRIGGLWKTTTGGDGKYSSQNFQTSLAISHITSSGTQDTIVAAPCSKSSIKVIYKNLSCNFAHLDSVGITGMTPAEYSTTLTHHTACEGLADTLTITFEILPPGQRNFSLCERYLNDEYQVIDTTLQLTLISPVGPDNVGMSFDASAGNKDTLRIGECQPGLLNLYFINLPCSFTHLEQITVDSLDPSEYTIRSTNHTTPDFSPDTAWISIIPIFPTTRKFFVHVYFENDDHRLKDTIYSFVVQPISSSDSKIYLKPTPLSAFVADTLDIPLYINGPIPNVLVRSNLDSVVCDFVMNTDLLSPIKFIPAQKDISSSSLLPMTNSAELTLHFLPGFVFTNETLLGSIRCIPYLSDTLTTRIELHGISVSSGCLSPLALSDVQFDLRYQCSDSLLMKYLKYGSTTVIERIIPNPADNFITVRLRHHSVPLEYRLIDRLGVERRSGTVASDDLRLDLEQLPAGVYYFRIINKSNPSGVSKVVIER
ncbi:MAG: T9SS type A sorting domain-containing protein, partial [Ignavibacteriota bacterium]